MNLTKTEITKLFNDNKKNAVKTTELSKSMQYNLGLTNRFPIGFSIEFEADSMLEMHQFKNSVGELIGVPTLCLVSDDTYITINSLSKKCYDSATPKEGTFPTVKVCENAGLVQFNEIKEDAKSLFFLKDGIKLTSKGSDTFINADFLTTPGKLTVVDGVILTSTGNSTQWVISLT